MPLRPAVTRPRVSVISGVIIVVAVEIAACFFWRRAVWYLYVWAEVAEFIICACEYSVLSSSIQWIQRAGYSETSALFYQIKRRHYPNAWCILEFWGFRIDCRHSFQRLDPFTQGRKVISLKKGVTFLFELLFRICFCLYSAIIREIIHVQHGLWLTGSYLSTSQYLSELRILNSLNVCKRLPATNLSVHWANFNS